MKKKLLSLAFLPLLVACVETTTPPEQKKAPPKPTTTKPVANKPAVTRSSQSALSAFSRVTRRMEPIAERSCREVHRKAPASVCDFIIKIDKNPKTPANASQSKAKDGRPVITFNINLMRTLRNDHEFAFIFGHEAGHQIASHLSKGRGNATAGAVVGGILAGLAGISVQTGMDLGSTVGFFSYAKEHELEADRIGTHIAYRGGYDPVIGAKSFAGRGGSNAFLSTHPPSQNRINTVHQTAAQIRAYKASGKGTPPITWKKR